MLHHSSTPDIKVPDIKVLGEQDGPAERRLKEALAVKEVLLRKGTCTL